MGIDTLPLGSVNNQRRLVALEATGYANTKDDWSEHDNRSDPNIDSDNEDNHHRIHVCTSCG